MAKAREFYTATKGVENEGYEFEIAMSCFYCISLCYNEAVEDFKIAIYDEKFYPFDDVVLDILTQRRENYAIQLKHVKDKLVLSGNHFVKNGKMVLSKYFKFDFPEGRHVVLLTNGILHEELTVGTCHIKAKRVLTDMEKNFDTSPEEEDHIYEICDEGTSKKVTFFTSQKSRTDIDVSVKKMIGERFYIDDKSAEVTLRRLKTFFQHWKRGKFGSYKLDKEDIKMKIAEILLHDHIFLPQPNCGRLTEDKIVLLRDILNSFNTIAEDTNGAEIKSLFCSELGCEELLEYKDNFLIVSHENEAKEKAIVFWRCKKFPLVLMVDGENKKMICRVISDLENENLYFLLLGNVSRSDFEHLKIFQNLKDLESADCYQDIIEKFTLSIQGNEEVSLKQLVEINPKFSEIFTIKEMLKMATEDFSVGESEGSLPQPYIPRRVLTTVLKISSITQLPNDLFVLDGSPEVIKMKLPKCKFWSFEEYNKRTSLGEVLPPKSVIICGEEFFVSCLKYKNGNVHCLKLIDDENLELISSKKRSEKLKKFQIFLEDQLHLLLKNNINLVCARPGMGKLTLMRYLKSNCPPGFWTVKVDLQENKTGFFRNGDSDFLSKVVDRFHEVRRVMFFFYEIDNLPQNDLIEAIKMIRRWAEHDYKVWIFSEDHLRETLEKHFGVLSMDIEELGEEERLKYIRGRFQSRRIDRGSEKIFENLRILKNSDILGAPMHLFMLTEIFMSDPDAKMEEIFILTDIYRYFIKTKFLNYLDKTSHERQNQITEDGIYYRNEQYKIAAMSSLDSVRVGKTLQCDEFFLTQIRKIGDVIGIILKIGDNGNVVFTQQTYADYFAALWLVDNFDKVEMKKFIFREEFRNIFFMFNLEICKKFPSHIAVLYQNLHQLRKHQTLTDVDSLGRSPLHLACSYGPKLKDVRMESVEEDKERRKIFDYLIENTSPDSLQKDFIFGWDPLDYAINTMDLYAIERFLSKFPEIRRVVFDKLTNSRNDMRVVIYYSIKWGYENLVILVSQTDIFPESLSMENSNGETLLHLAVKSGNLPIVTTLLDSGAAVDNPTSTYNKRSPLHVATENDHHEIVDVLLDRGATVDIMDRYRDTPLHLAAMKGAYQSVRHLLDHGSDVNFADNFGRTPLHLAATFGHRKTIKQLLDAGADIDKCDRLGVSPISCAKDREIVGLLSEKGANLSNNNERSSANNYDEYTTHQLHWVCSTGLIERVDPLLQDGWSINEVDSYGCSTPLYRAVDKRYLKIVEKLINRSADLNIPDKNGIVPLCRAVSNDDFEMTALLVKNDANVDVRDSYGYAPLHWGAAVGNAAIVELLLSKNPDVEVTDNFGRKPADVAAENGHCEIVQILDNDPSKLLLAEVRSGFLSHYRTKVDGMDPTLTATPFEDAIDSGNCSLVEKFLKQGRKNEEMDRCLYRAAIKRHLEVIKLLLQEGANVNTTDDSKSSILHWSVFLGHSEVVGFLLKHGASIDIPDAYGYSPLEIAVMQGHEEVLSLLIREGGNVNHADPNGNTPLDWACKRGRVECVAVLLERGAIGGIVPGDYLDVAKKQREFLETAKLY